MDQDNNKAHVAPMTYQGPQDDPMVKAIISCVCFWPVGIFAVMKANQARDAYARGDMAEGQSLASSSRTLSNVAIGLGIAFIVIFAIIIGVYFGLAVQATNTLSYTLGTQATNKLRDALGTNAKSDIYGASVDVADLLKNAYSKFKNYY